MSGLELLINYDLAKENAKVKFPLTFAYTLTNAIFQSSFGSDEDIWGTVSTGDRVPYIPQNQWSFTARLIHNKFELNFNSRYNSAFNIQSAAVAATANGTVPSNFIIDLSAKYNLSSRLKITSQVVNLLNETYLVSLVPAGFRPGHPFGFYSGLQFDL